MPNFVELVPPASSLWSRNGWHQFEISGLANVDWAELWLDLGLGYIRYHSVPLDINERNEAVGLVRLHRRPKAFAVRFGARSFRAEQKARLELRARRRTTVYALWRWLVAKNSGPFPISGLHVAPLSRPVDHLTAWSNPGDYSARTENPAGGPNEPAGVSVADCTEDLKLLLGTPAEKTIALAFDATVGTFQFCGCQKNGNSIEADEFECLNAHARNNPRSWLIIVEAGAQAEWDCLPKLTSHFDLDDSVVAYFGDHLPGPSAHEADQFGLHGKFCLHRLLAGEWRSTVYAVRASAVIAVGGWRQDDGKDASLGLCLRLLEHYGENALQNVPITLARRGRVVSGTDNIRSICVRTLERLHFPAAAYHPVANLKSSAPRTISVIIPTRDRVDLLQKAVSSILNDESKEYLELLIIDNGSTDPKTEYWINQKLKNVPNIKCIREGREFNFSALCNLGVKNSNGDVLAFINNDIEILSPNLLSLCGEMADHPSIGAVGPLLIYPDGSVQHAGVLTGPGGVAGHPLAGRTPDTCTTDVFPMVTRSVSAITGACLFVSREKFASVQGFDEDLAVAFNDVDLCLKLERSGWRNVLIPSCKAVHLESQSRSPDRHYDQEPRLRAEFDLMRGRWGERLDWDPWISNAIRVDNGKPSPFWGRNPSGREN